MTAYCDVCGDSGNIDDPQGGALPCPYCRPDEARQAVAASS